MRYVDAGYAICLAVLALYSASVVLRRRRLARADARRVGGAPPAKAVAAGLPAMPLPSATAATPAAAAVVDAARPRPPGP